MHDRRSFAGRLLAVATTLLLSPAALWASPGRALFVIARSKNANLLKFEVRERADGRLDPARPLDVYWLMLAENGRREELTWTERKFAYGFVVTRVSEQGCRLTLTACARRSIQVERTSAGYRAQLSIHGKPATLRRIFVRSHDGGLLPRVEYVELSGVDESGALVSERIAAT
ncbi:MAG TPA: DUF4833 domain-containing protein [Polyangiaceae bacterium]|jgi:hypothetical protein